MGTTEQISPERRWRSGPSGIWVTSKFPSLPLRTSHERSRRLEWPIHSPPTQSSAVNSWVDTVHRDDYVPILYQDKVKHTCSGCFPTRFRGSRFGSSKVWWRERQDQDAERDLNETKSSELKDRGDRYLCTKCYFQDPELLPKRI